LLAATFLCYLPSWPPPLLPLVAAAASSTLALP
jgi:hypothetical protein